MESKREEWYIEIRDDNRDGKPEITVHSEYVARNRDGDRLVDQALPPLRTALENIDDIPVVLSDGHQTTLGIVVASLRKAASAAIDQHEVDLAEEKRAAAAENEKMTNVAQQIAALSNDIAQAGGVATPNQTKQIEDCHRRFNEMRAEQDERARQRRHCLADKLRRHQNIEG